MGTLTIRNVDDWVVEKLKARAKENGRSLSAEVRLILTEESKRPSRKELLARADQMASMTLKVPQTDSAEILRKFRDR